MFFAAPLALLPLFTLALVRLPALQPLSAQGPITPDAAAVTPVSLRPACVTTGTHSHGSCCRPNGAEKPA